MKRSIFTVGLILIQTTLGSLAFAQTAPTPSGGGAHGGNGYPKKHIKWDALAQLPQSDNLRLLASQIAKEFPTIALRFIQMIDRFAVGTAYQVKKTTFSSEYEYSEYITSGERDPLTHFWSHATVRIWKNFYELPVLNDAVDGQSQTKAMLHELIHIYVTEQDEDTTELLTERLYALGRGKDLTPEQLQATADRLGYGKDLRLPGEVQQLEKFADFIAAKKLYLAAQNQEGAECSEFPLSHTETVNGTQLNFPTMDDHYRVHLGLDQFYLQYRDYCFLRSPTGKTLVTYKDELAHRTSPYFLHPLLHAEFLRNVMNKTALRVVLSPALDKKNRYRENGFSSYPILTQFENLCSMVDALYAKLQAGRKDYKIDGTAVQLAGATLFRNWQQMVRETHLPSEYTFRGDKDSYESFGVYRYWSPAYRYEIPTFHFLSSSAVNSSFREVERFDISEIPATFVLGGLVQVTTSGDRLICNKRTRMAKDPYQPDKQREETYWQCSYDDQLFNAGYLYPGEFKGSSQCPRVVSKMQDAQQYGAVQIVEKTSDTAEGI